MDVCVYEGACVVIYYPSVYTRATTRCKDTSSNYLVLGTIKTTTSSIYLYT